MFLLASDDVDEVCTNGGFSGGIGAAPVRLVSPIPSAAQNKAAVSLKFARAEIAFASVGEPLLGVTDANEDPDNSCFGL